MASAGWTLRQWKGRPSGSLTSCSGSPPNTTSRSISICMRRGARPMAYQAHRRADQGSRHAGARVDLRRLQPRAPRVGRYRASAKCWPMQVTAAVKLYRHWKLITLKVTSQTLVNTNLQEKALHTIKKMIATPVQEAYIFHLKKYKPHHSVIK